MATDTEPLLGTGRLALGDDGRIDLPSAGPWDGLLRLADWTEWDAGTNGGDVFVALSPARIAADTARRGSGADLAAVVARIDGCVEPALSGAQAAQIQAAMRAHRHAEVRWAAMLRLVGVDGNDLVRAAPTLRRHLRAVVRPGEFVIEADAVGRLRRRLERLGIEVHDARSDRPADGAEADVAAWLMVAARVLDHLAVRHGLGDRVPRSLHDVVGDGADGERARTAALAAKRIIAQLDARLEPRLDARPDARMAGAAPGTTGGSREADPLEVWQDAADSGADVALRYWSPESGVTDRQVTPAAVEWRGDRVYLIGRCHVAGAERTFRLDRVIRVVRGDDGRDAR